MWLKITDESVINFNYYCEIQVEYNDDAQWEVIAYSPNPEIDCALLFTSENKDSCVEYVDKLYNLKLK